MAGKVQYEVERYRRSGIRGLNVPGDLGREGRNSKGVQCVAGIVLVENFRNRLVAGQIIRNAVQFIQQALDVIGACLDELLLIRKHLVAQNSAEIAVTHDPGEKKNADNRCGDAVKQFCSDTDKSFHELSIGANVIRRNSVGVMP